VIRGHIRPDRPLLVTAIEEEAQFLTTDLPVLITGVGKVNAAVSVARALSDGVRPSMLVNLGTAGALRPGLAGLHLVGRVHQHDLVSRKLREQYGDEFGETLTLVDDGGLALATGDTFIDDERRRARLAERADLVDMEGYGVAAAGARFGVPVRMVKQVSDDAGADARRTWNETITDCARILADWVATYALPETASN
jgi:adenosylhomocysteine nucleosidase